MLVALVFLLCLLVPCAGACENVAETGCPSSPEEECDTDVSENVCEENLQENCEESPAESECPDKTEDQICPKPPEDTCPESGDSDESDSGVSGDNEDSSEDTPAGEGYSDESAEDDSSDDSDVSDSANNNRDEHNGRGYGEENVTIRKKPEALNISSTNVSVDIERPKTLLVIPQNWINLCVKTNLGEQEKNCIIRWIICPENDTVDGSMCIIIIGNNQTCTNLSNGNYTVNITVWDSNWISLGSAEKNITIRAPINEDFSSVVVSKTDKNETENGTEDNNKEKIRKKIIQNNFSFLPPIPKISSG